MTVKVSKPAINVREELADLRKPSGVAGEAMLRAETPQEQFNLIGAGRRNMVVNGALQVAQRGTSTTGIGASSVFGSVDRFQIGSGTTGRVTMAQDSVTDLAGFTKCIKISCTTARTPSAAELMFLRYAWEGHDLQRISKGTANAKPTKLSFYVKASGVFNMACELYDADNNRHISQLFATSTGWNRIELNIPADTTGAYGDDNGAGLLMQLWFHGGTDRTSGTLASTWATKSSNTNQAAGISNFLSSTDNEFYFTGFQYEVGTEATPFEHRFYGEELALCQRYYQNVFYGGVANNAGLSQSYGNWYTLPTPMRASPTVSRNSNTTFWDFPGANQNSSDLAFEGINTIHNSVIRGKRTTTTNMTYFEGHVICKAEL